MRSPTACLISGPVILRCNEFAMNSFTSSTPLRAASSTTSSRTSWRTSGGCIGGSGSEMSSIAIVSFMPGVRSSASGSLPCGFASACRIAARTSRIRGSASGG